MEIKVSVVVPVYNAENYLQECLDSIVNQTLKEIEIICVDDGSSDGSLNILREFAEQDTRIHVIQQNNLYAGVARNNGLKHASGQYVMFLDADDFFEPNMLETLYKQSVKTNADVCVCDGRAYLNDKKVFAYPLHYLENQLLPNKEVFSYTDIPEYILLFTSPAPWNKIFRREFIVNNGIKFQDLKKSNDLYFVYLALVCAERITTVQKCLINYRTCHIGSLQTTYTNIELYFYDALKSLKNELIKRNKYVEVEKSFVNRSLNTCIYHLDKIRDIQLFLQLCQQMKGIFYALGVWGHTSGYFYSKDNFIQALKIMDTDPYILWKSIFENKKPLRSTIDFCKLQPEYDEIQWGYPKISVIIPVYNVQKYLEEALDSVINQSLKEIEIICVDDGSTDDSFQILEKYANVDDRIKVYQKVNGGLSSARNLGINKATGKYVYFIDSDDILESKALEICFDESEKNDLDMIMFSAEPFYDNRNIISDIKMNCYKRYAEYNGIVSGKDFFIKAVSAAELKPSACLYIIRRDMLIKNKLFFYEGIIHEDNLFTIQCLSLANRVKYINCDFYKRRVRENSIMTSSAALYRAYSLYIVITEINKFLNERCLVDNQPFYFAVLKQMVRIRNEASNFLSDMTQEELMSETEKLPNGMAFYFYICEPALLKKEHFWAVNATRDEKSRKYKLEFDLESEKEKNRILKQENSSLKHLAQRCKRLEKSWSYRIGKAVTFIPRKIKKTFTSK